MFQDLDEEGEEEDEGETDPTVSVHICFTEFFGIRLQLTIIL